LESALAKNHLWLIQFHQGYRKEPERSTLRPRIGKNKKFKQSWKNKDEYDLDP